MVCKKSLYCWKNGPCASDQTRKQIWEDNIRFRESLRDINQSDHYWSFQISKTLCMCSDGEFLCNRPLSRKYRSASLQSLHQTDCTSIAHDINGLNFRNCYVHCPSHYFGKSSEVKRTDTPLSQSLLKKDNELNCVKYPLQTLPKPDRGKPEYCHRYINSLTTPKLKPCLKKKFLSQTNLISPISKNNMLEKKSLHASCDNIKLKSLENTVKPCLGKVEKEINIEEKVNSDGKQVQSPPLEKETKCKKLKKLKPVKFPNQGNLYEYIPVSRTTRKMLSETKKVPFVTYGCNNNNLDIGSKRTHNVFASKLEVYPNALSAKQQKKNYILKHIQTEKEIQKNNLPQELRKRRINHSSLWSLDNLEKEYKKNTKYVLPIMTKPPKQVNLISNDISSTHYRTYRKPKIYFY